MKSVVMFPGQGSLKYEHLKLTYELGKDSRDFIDYICNAAGSEFKENFFNNENSLSDSVFAQQALFTVSIASFIDKFETNSDIMLIGHSLGEVIAVVASGMIDLKTGFEVVTKRAEIMAENLYESFMAAVIGVPETIVNNIAKESFVYPANYNSPKQTVVAGLKRHFNTFKEKAVNSGGKVILLNVKVPSHTPLMTEASEKFYKFLKNVEFKEPRFPILGCETPDFITAENIRERLSIQLIKPVLWSKAVNSLLDNNYENFMEVGFSKVLSAILRKIESER